jgi:tetratricopeptide (TPR) repeat protein
MSLEIFCCYARKDQLFLEELRTQLDFLQRLKQATIWADIDINAGTPWENEIKKHLNTAQIILLLISANFIASDYCYSIEMKTALGRHARGEACVIPVIIRPCSWKGTPLGKLQALPKDAKAVTSRDWHTPDDAFLSIANGVEKVVSTWAEKERLWNTCRSYYKSGQYKEALTDIEAIAGLGFDYVQLYKTKGDALFQLKAYKDALDAYNYALSLNPDERDLYNAKGLVLYRLGRNREAVISYEETIKRGSSSPGSLAVMGLALCNLGECQKALDTCEEALRLDPNTTDAYLGKGHALCSLGHYDEALSAFDEVLHRAPDYKSAYRGKGDALYVLERYDEALAAFEQVIRLSPDAGGYNSKGNALFRLQRYDEAASAYEEAIRLGLKSADTYYDLGSAFYHLRRYAEAVTVYNDAITLRSDFAVAYYDLGNAHYQLQQYEQAKRAYQKSIELGYNSAKAPYDLGNAHYQLQEYEEAVEAYKRAISLDPRMAVAYFDLGNTLSCLHRFKEAARAYQQALLLEPHITDYEEAFAGALAQKPELPGDEHYPEHVAQAIRECYYQLGGATSHLGLPRKVKPEDVQRNSSRGTEGFRRSFYHGAIYWSVRGGAQPVWWGIYELYSRHKGPQGIMGFPLTSELDAAPSSQNTVGKFQRFEGEWDYPEDVPPVPVRYGASAYYSKKYGSHLVSGEIGRCYERLGGTSGRLGFPTASSVEVGPSEHGTKGKYKSFEGGLIYWSKRTGAHPIWDAILDLYNLENVRKRLGFPISDEEPARTSPQGTTGVFQRFEGGQHDGRPVDGGTDFSQGVAVYSTTAYGAFPVWGGLGLCYEQLGGTGSHLGFPISMEQKAGQSSQGTEGWFQCFEGGVICWSEKYGGIPVVGAISTSYNVLRRTEGEYGFPKAPEEPVAGYPDLVRQAFEGGVICAPASRARYWEDMYAVVDLIHWIYEQIFDRRADESGLVTYGGALHRGEKSVKDVVRILAHSKEYKDRYIEGIAIEDAVNICFERLLARTASESEREMYGEIAQTNEFDKLIDVVIESEEYRANFGKDDVPQLLPGLAVASTHSGHLECFYRGQDHHLWHRWRKGTDWSEEEDLGDLLTSAPAAVSSWGGNRIDCFYRGQNHHLLHRWWDGTKWNDEENLGGFLASAPTVASQYSNHLECFYRGRDNHLWHRYWYGSQWSEERNLGGFLTSAPAAISWGENRIDCFYRGRRNHLCHRWWNGANWSEEEDLEGFLTSAPAVASLGPDHLDCYYRGRDAKLWHRQWDGIRWSEEECVPGWLTSAPAVVSGEINRIDCFYRGGNNALWHRWRNGSRWSEEEEVGGSLA